MLCGNNEPSSPAERLEAARVPYESSFWTGYAWKNAARTLVKVEDFLLFA